ncbi:S-methyl-5'-thioadenosine phosphorylase [Pseudoblastomonas halimionae]|uniref:S-methyl-5'-thioadenosine phosphorylase n=1 Tax=Alteriqipengyuania halimionae TaxID=1926630 RepID=A0A6I4U725_9SPHN|nr:S-methyl-5'-thioadenosine phosphorylase [Alteriqipengyuania halimionae]MXP10191.1 S-methyl-5'-thioadenosine phosphorylase [Alteriqipengyuania halimionae]
MSDNWFIGIIGGSGLSEGLELEEAQEVAIKSPFGEPSGPVTLGRIGGVRVAFLARHGQGHRVPPSQVNYRANIDVLKRARVTDVLALSAIGSLREEIAPGEFVAVDQFIDRTTSRENSFFGPGCVAHVSLADPVCPRLAQYAGDAAKAAGAALHRGGTYVAIDGPQFSTRAESRLYRAWAGDVIGMTGMPEARLAREAELPYAMLGMATDYDSFRDEEAGVDVTDVLSIMRDNASIAAQTVVELCKSLPAERSRVPIDTALEHAIITAPDARDPELVTRLDAVAGRVLS